MPKNEFAELAARLRTRAMQQRHDWEPFCQASKLLQEYGRGQEKPNRDVLSAIVLVESTIEALEVERLHAVERVALECGRQVVRRAWRRRDSEQRIVCGAGAER